MGLLACVSAAETQAVQCFVGVFVAVDVCVLAGVVLW